MAGRGLIPLSGIGDSSPWHDPARFLLRYVHLGEGTAARSWILGDATAGFWVSAEALAMAVLLITVIVLSIRGGADRRLLSAAGMMAVAYLLTGLSVYALPRSTFIHHWILGTPLQYLAIAIAAAVFVDMSVSITRAERAGRWVLFAALAVLAIVRLHSIGVTEAALASGHFSPRFHPAFTRLGRLASQRADDSTFIVADWGTGTQIFCLGNGRPDLIHELFWESDPAAELARIVASTRKNNLYVLRTGIDPRFQGAASSILSAMQRMPGWRPAPVEKDFAQLPLVEVRKFTRMGDSSSRHIPSPLPYVASDRGLAHASR